MILITNGLVFAVLSLLQGNTTEYVLAVDAYSSATFVTISLVIVGIVILAYLFKISQIGKGGRIVAETLGGRLLTPATTDPNERKVLNIVAEMALAAGTTVPPVYLYDESAINAFAAGFKPKDAVIGLTSGAISTLNREELQGVVAHEFSHILHGDMRLNMRLIGVLYGIMFIGLIGHFLLRNLHFARLSGRATKNQGALPFLALGAGLSIIGFGGTFFGNLIKASVSRQREFLADASAVQFTRNPEGIGGALKKIGGYSAGTQLNNPRAAELSHMFFGEAVAPAFSSLFATHPPLSSRIQRIDPQWNGEFPSVVANETYSSELEAEPDTPLSSFYGTATAAPSVAELQDWVGNPGVQQLDYSVQMVGSLPAAVLDACHESFGARAVVFSLFLDHDTKIRNQQLQSIKKLTGDLCYRLTQKLVAEYQAQPQQRLPLLDLCIPALTELSPPQYKEFRRCLVELIQADKRIDLFEWTLFRLLVVRLDPHRNRLKDTGQIKDIRFTSKASGLLLSAVAHSSEKNEQAAIASFEHAKSYLGLPGLKYVAPSNYHFEDLSRALAILNRLAPLKKPKLLKALCEAALHGKPVQPEQLELIRAVADSLDCPIPPLIDRSSIKE